MANRFSMSTLLAALVLVAVTGCQQPTAGPSPYVAPSFGPPRLVSAQQPAVVPMPTPPMAVVPRPPVVRRATPAAAVPPPAVAMSVPRGWVPPVPPRPWKWIVIHHSDTEHGGLAFIDQLHKDKGWDGVGYDFVIGNGTDTGDGQVEPTYRWTRQVIGAHAKTPDNRYNEYGIGICLVGNMMEHAPTPKQMAAVERLSAFLMATYHIAPDHMLRHGETKSTDCPGKYTNLALIRAAATRAAGGMAAIAGSSYHRPAGEMLVQVSPPSR